MDKNRIIEIIFEKYTSREKIRLIFLTGSSKNLVFDEAKDIDVFVIDNCTDKQFREIKKIYGFEFDINIISEKLARSLIKNNEAFMIKAISESNPIWGEKDIYNSLKDMV